MSLAGKKLPGVSKEFVDILKAKIIAPTLRPGFDKEQAIWDAGRRDLVNMIEREAGQWQAQENLVSQTRTKSCDTLSTSTENSTSTTRSTLSTLKAVLVGCWKVLIKLVS